MPQVLAQDEELTTAKDVVEAAPEETKETLKKFVESARDHFLTLPFAALLELGATLREEGGDWNYKSMYLVVLQSDGTAFYHGEDPSKDGENLTGEVDDNGKMVVQEIVTALIENDEEEVFVEYSWDDPSTDEDVNPRYCYAIKGGHPALAGQVFILVGGYHNNVASMAGEPEDIPLALDFAHFANGGGITSDIVVVNASDNAVQPEIYFYDKMGELIDAASVVDVMGQGLEVTSEGALTVPNAIPPLGEVTIPTHGMGDMTTTGSVKVVSDSSGSSIGGVLRFDLQIDMSRVGVAGVGASQPVRDAIFPARRMAGGINTGAAFRNLSESAQVLTCRLMKDGQQLGDDRMVDLAANGQDARFIDQLFPGPDTSDFTGSVRCMSPAGDQEFTAVALEMDTNNGVFTTLPVVPVAAGASGSGNGNQTTLYFAHFANGGGITSDIVVVNAAATAAQPEIYFYDKMGELIDAGSVVDVMGQGLEVTSDGALTVPNAIPPLGEVTIPTHGMGDMTTTGSVKVVSDSSGSSIGGVLRFDLQIDMSRVGVAGVGASQPVRDAIFPARRMAGGINTGAAFRNLSESAQVLTCRLMKDGQQLGDDRMVDLAANGQDARFIDQLFPGPDTSDFTGSVRCMSPAGDQEFTAVALEMDTNNRVFTTLPVVPVAQ
ncbi:MAG: cache domain-containing protein [Candidatus Aminicenantes bacterium]|nr:cache domain-containing protein [Candidatus Aminicenantes bacterium]